MTRRATAFAKVNLTLRVLGRRADGYHDIASCMHEVELADELSLRPLEQEGAIAIEVTGARRGHAVPADADNLVWRATQAFRAATGTHAGVSFTLHKRIPAGGGLGGGSADAAAALRLLCAEHGLSADQPRWGDVAASLGADVPFFLAGGTQLARGVGERLERVAGPPRFEFVLVVPPFGTETAAVYRAWQPAAAGEVQRPLLPATPAQMFNDLEEPALRIQPALAGLRARIVAAGYEQVRLSGSGSTMFLAFPEASAADAAARALGFLADEGVELLRTRSAAPTEQPIEGDNRGLDR